MIHVLNIPVGMELNVQTEEAQQCAAVQLGTVEMLTSDVFMIHAVWSLVDQVLSVVSQEGLQSADVLMDTKEILMLPAEEMDVLEMCVECMQNVQMYMEHQDVSVLQDFRVTLTRDVSVENVMKIPTVHLTRNVIIISVLILASQLVELELIV